MRGYFLVHLALHKLLLKELNLEEDERAVSQELAEKYSSNSLTIKEINANSSAASLNQIIDDLLANTMEKGRKPKLWVQYLKIVNIVKNFIAAERSGNWELHLSCVRNMLPYFHATGRHLYAKCAHLYLRDMLNLDESTRNILSTNVAIRRSEKFWSGIWSDMTIEQTLMRSIKSIGGLVHGRSTTENVTNQWILSMPFSLKICEAVEEYANISISTSEQQYNSQYKRYGRRGCAV